MLENKFESPENNISTNDASQEDIQAILNIQQEKRSKATQENSNAEKEGFLIYSITPNDLEGAIADKNDFIIKVAKQENKTVGYLMSYDMGKWLSTHPQWFLKFKGTEEKQNILKTSKVLYGRHIAVSDETISAGVGQKLLDSTLQDAQSRGYEYFIVEVALNPLTNIRSINFVQKNDFELISSNEDESGNKWAVFLKELS